VSFSYTKKHTFDTVLINDKVNNQSFVKNNNYVFDKNFPIWLLYRDDFFDEILNGLNIDIFKVFRDRQITNKILLDKGDIQCLK
jgi:DNA (cytosine-5)-methyltransferase 1